MANAASASWSARIIPQLRRAQRRRCARSAGFPTQTRTSIRPMPGNGIRRRTPIRSCIPAAKLLTMKTAPWRTDGAMASARIVAMCAPTSEERRNGRISPRKRISRSGAAAVCPFSLRLRITAGATACARFATKIVSTWNTRQAFAFTVVPDARVPPRARRAQRLRSALLAHPDTRTRINTIPAARCNGFQRRRPRTNRRTAAAAR